jgi:hypothetical protein
MTILETVFVGLENDVLSYHSRLFLVNLNSTGEISLKIKRINCPFDCPNGMGLSAIGHVRYISKYLAQHGSEINIATADKIALVRSLIQGAIDNAIDGEIVGGPIVILRLTKDGAEWIQNDSVCPDIIRKPQKEKTKTSKTKNRRR